MFGLLKDRCLLRAGGSFCAMEPNPSYWLAGRYGDPAQPYAVVTEYRNPVFNVAPTLDRLLPVMAQAGFALKDLRHPGPPSALAHSGPTADAASRMALASHPDLTSAVVDTYRDPNTRKTLVELVEGAGLPEGSATAAVA